jgi:lactate dehydrogenase-like 2-hydroxyacid dehydrogenase
MGFTANGVTALPTTAKVVLVGTLPGNVEAKLACAVDLMRADDYRWMPSDVIAAAPQVRGVVAGDVSAQLRGRDAQDIGTYKAITGITESFLKSFPALEIVASFGVGYENIDAKAAARLGIVVTHTPNVLTEEVADTAMGLLLSTVRKFPQADRFLRSGRWLEGQFPLGATLRGRRLGIVGLGRIGKAVARRAESFGLEVVYHGRSRQAGVPYQYFESLLEMARYVDVLMLCVPGGPSSTGLVTAEVLRALGSEGVLINVARGSVVDERALIGALRDKTILTAGLDVFSQEPHVSAELIAMDHIVLTPHLGSSSLHTRTQMAQLCVDNLLKWLSEGRPLTPVPETPFTKAETHPGAVR